MEQAQTPAQIIELIRATPAAMLVLQGKRIVYANPAAVRLTGYGEAELLQMEFWQILHPAFQAVLREDPLKPNPVENLAAPFEVRLVARSCEEHRLSMVFSEITWNAKPARLVTAFDITQDGKAAAQPETGTASMNGFPPIVNALRKADTQSLSKSLLQAILDVTPDPVFLKDRQSRMLMANSATFQLLGKPAERVIGFDDSQFYDDPAVGLAMMENDRRIMTLGQTEVVEEKVVVPGGHLTYLSTKTPYRDAAGNVIGIIGLARDITDRKEKERELAQLNRTLKASGDVNQAMVRASTEEEFLAASCAIVVEDSGHPMVWIGYAENDEAKSVRPVAHAGFENGYLETLSITWADVERGRGPTGTAIRTGKTTGCDNMLTDPYFAPWREEALKRGYGSSRVLPLMDGGKAFGALTIYSREPNSFIDKEVWLLEELANDLSYGIITFRVRAAHARAEAALNESEERYRRLVDLAPLGIGVHNGKTWLFINPAMARLFGASEPVEIVGKPVMRFIHPDDREGVKERIRQIVVDNQMAPQREIRMIGLDKREFYVEASGIKTTYLGKPAVQVIYQDVTERNRNQQALQKARNELEMRVEERTEELVQANQKLEAALCQEQRMREQLIQSEKFTAMGHMLASVAHEINNPLQTIKNCLFLIRTQTDPESPVQEYLEMSVSETKRLSNLVAQLRELYRPQAASRPVSLSRMLNEVGCLLLPYLADNHVTWVLSSPEEDIVIDCVADQVKQIFINICMNAAEAMQPQGGTLSVEVLLPGENGLVGIVFQDTGPGIPPAVQARLFEPFVTTKSSGVGLGLSITYELVQRHHGRISAESRENQGAVFTVWLPVAQLEQVQP